MSDKSIGMERRSAITDKEASDMGRRAQRIFEHLAERRARPGEAEALRLGFDRRESGDTNWLGLATAAELAKAGHDLVPDDQGRMSIVRVNRT